MNTKKITAIKLLHFQHPHFEEEIVCTKMHQIMYFVPSQACYRN